MQDSFETLYNIIQTDYLERNSILNLNASENHMSQVAKYILGLHPAYDCYEFPPIAVFNCETLNMPRLPLISSGCAPTRPEIKPADILTGWAVSSKMILSPGG